MLTKIIVSISTFFAISLTTIAQQTHELSFQINVSENLRPEFDRDGRLLICLSTDSTRAPIQSMRPNSQNNVIANNITDFPVNEGLSITHPNGWTSVFDWSFGDVPEGVYYIQALWDADPYFGLYQNGNLYSKSIAKITVDKSTKVDITLDGIFERNLPELLLLREIDMVSDTLSKFWGKPMHVKAAVLLPSGYDEEANVAYPIRYNVAGYGGRYYRVRNLVYDFKFMPWWLSDESPQVINVFLDGYGPFGDCYQLDSENGGPYGYSLINELIPFIESKYRGTDDMETRFVDGCSTGGWVSLALQLYYPDVFNGCFSYSPDGVDFENFQLINIYEDPNAFINEHGYEQPMRRTTKGEPMWSMRDYIAYENVISPTDSYIQSGGQFSAFNALYGPRTESGLPSVLFDPETGAIDHDIAEQWKKYDLLNYVKENWSTLGPKLDGKIFVSMGDMDDFYLNIALRSFDEFLKSANKPKSNAIIEFLPTVGHCRQYSHRTVLEQIAAKLDDQH